MNTTCQLHHHAFRLNGKDVFLYSAEMHYFRIPRRHWARHLEAAVDAGCNAVSSYAPWSWHEYEEGKIDLTGATHPERDLIGFLDQVKAAGLHATLKPGPYANAELTDQGIPAWLTETYPQTLARDEHGNPWGPCFVSQAEPLFRDRARRWLTAFVKRIVVPRQGLKRGAVLMLQLCNEIGMFEWLGGRGSYAAANVQAWRRYLETAFPRLGDLEQLLDRKLSGYAEIRPPSAMCSTRRDYVLYRIWHDFHRWLYADYAKFLHDLLREAGAEVPLFTNVGGWVYGRAHEFPLNATFLREAAKSLPDLLAGVDHIPEFVTPHNLHDGLIANHTARELQRKRGPLYSAEMQCGSREFGVQTYPQELGLFYRLCMIHGLTGINFYMFSQGRNPKGRGVDGPMFYWYTAVDEKGRRLPTWRVVRDLGEWLRANGNSFVRSQRPASLAVAWYPPLFESEFLVPILHKQTKLDAGALGLSQDPVSFRNASLLDGLVRLLVRDSIPFDFADLTRSTAQALRKYPCLALVTNELMDASTQRKLVDYVRAGGKLILFPMCPTHDLDFQPCALLRDGLGLGTRGVSDGNRVYLADLKDIPVAQPPLLVRGGRVIARDAKGRAVGVEKRLGKGAVRFFGFHVHYRIEEHPDLWAAMLELPGAARNAEAIPPVLHVEARFSRGEGFLFVGNFHREEASAHLRVHAPRGRTLDLGRVTLPALAGLLLPLARKLRKDLELVYAWAELLGTSQTARHTDLVLRSLAGAEVRVLLRGKRIRRCAIDGEAISLEAVGRDSLLRFAASGQKQLVRLWHAT